MENTLSAVKQLARQARCIAPSQNNHPQTLNWCSDINSGLRLAIQQDLGVPAHLIRGAVKGPSGNTAPHVFVKIPAGCLADTSGPVIADGAFDQFNDANATAGAVDVSFGPPSDVDEVVVTPVSSTSRYIEAEVLQQGTAPEPGPNPDQHTPSF